MENVNCLLCHCQHLLFPLSFFSASYSPLKMPDSDDDSVVTLPWHNEVSPYFIPPSHDPRLPSSDRRLAESFFSPNTTVVPLSDRTKNLVIPPGIDIHRQYAELLVQEKITSPQSICFTHQTCLLYTSPSPRDLSTSRMPSSA